MARLTRCDLLTHLERAEIPFVEIMLAGGGSGVVTARGARLLGLFPGQGESALSALWTNEQLDALLSGHVRDWVGEGVGSIGGERLWIGPERSFCYRRPETFEEWFCPPPMDPGHYELQESSRPEAALENTFDLEDVRAGRTYRRVRAQRRFEALDDPFADDPPTKVLTSGLEYAGIRKTDTLELPDAPPDAKVNLWVLALLEAAADRGVGTVVIPTKSGAKPIDYFGGLPSERLIKCSDHVAFRLDGQSIGKIGVRPEDIPSGRAAQIAAFLPAAEREDLLLVIHRSWDVPRNQAECFDEAKADPTGPKGAVQAYNHGPGADPTTPWKCFGEIEIQLAPARSRKEGGGLGVTATSDLLAYEGARGQILTLGCAALGVRAIQLFE